MTDEIRNTLTERGRRYGEFEDHAKLSRALSNVFWQHVNRNGVANARTFNDSQVEALTMIFHKIARIGNGDPYYDDSWRDIAGYAQLVVDILNRPQAPEAPQGIQTPLQLLREQGLV